MKVFISWSGERSGKVAELLSGWIKKVIQSLQPWISSKDIDKGTFWFNEINKQLADTVIGIICLTKENKDRPWIQFESGALAKGLATSRIVTLLIDLNNQDIDSRNPLYNVNHTQCNKADMLKLILSIYHQMGDPNLNEQEVAEAFDTYWPRFEDGFKEIISTNEDHIELPQRSESELLTELLETVRSVDIRVRKIEENIQIFGLNTQLKDLLFDTALKNIHPAKDFTHHSSNHSATFSLNNKSSKSNVRFLMTPKEDNSEASSTVNGRQVINALQEKFPSVVIGGSKTDPMEYKLELLNSPLESGLNQLNQFIDPLGWKINIVTS